MSTPFVLLARCCVQDRDAFLQAADACDRCVQQTEPGMLHHILASDPADEQSFVWTEVYADEESLRLHLQSDALKEFVAQQTGNAIKLEVYGTLDEDLKQTLRDTGFEVEFYETHLGFTRLAVPLAPADDTNCVIC